MVNRNEGDSHRKDNRDDNRKLENHLRLKGNAVKSGHKNSLTKPTAMSVNDSTIIDVGVPTSEVSVSSSNKRKATNDISTVTTHSSKVKYPLVDTDISPIYQLFQFVMVDKFYRSNRSKKWNLFNSKSKVIRNDRRYKRKDKTKEKMCVEKIRGKGCLLIII